MADRDFCTALGELYRGYVVPILEGRFEEITRYTHGHDDNIAALANEVRGHTIRYGEFLDGPEISAAGLLEVKYVIKQLKQEDGWELFGRSYRLGGMGDIEALRDYIEEVPLLAELFTD
ncbi:MAG: hypothetical protein GF368_00065 [Candidatus Aenigmarchaeota archaeon]|nr:hypothetical protein [Candidatus Aenigmarchaeota archaeon]